MRFCSCLAASAFAWSLTVITCFAQSVYPANPVLINNDLDTIAPYRGTYYDPNKAGTGIQVDFGANGGSFITYYTYSPTGQPDWYILAGSYVPSDEVARWTTGVIGTADGPFYQAFNGQCMGCPYQPNGGAVVSSYTGHLEWVNSREVKMTVGNESWDFIAPNFEGKPDGDYLIGTWAVHIVQRYLGYQDIAKNINIQGAFTHDAMAIIKITPDSAGVTVATNAAPGLTNFVPTAKLYKWSCDETLNSSSGNCYQTLQYTEAETCASTGGFPNRRYEFWFDPATDRIGVDTIDPGSRKIGPVNSHVDLYMQSPDLFIGRGIIEGTGVFSTDTSKGALFGLCTDGSMNLEMILQRVPDIALGIDGDTN